MAYPNVIKYKPDIMIPRLKELMAEGKTVSSFCAEFDIALQTYYDWIEAHIEFKAAAAEGSAKTAAWWEEYAQNNMENPNLNYKTLELNVRNRLKWLTRDPQSTNITVNANGSISDSLASVKQAADKVLLGMDDD